MSLNMKKIESGPTFFFYKNEPQILWRKSMTKKRLERFPKENMDRTKSFVEKKYTE